jgi:hypothetical protein
MAGEICDHRLSCRQALGAWALPALEVDTEVAFLAACAEMKLSAADPAKQTVVVCNEKHSMLAWERDQCSGIWAGPIDPFALPSSMVYKIAFE